MQDGERSYDLYIGWCLAAHAWTGTDYHDPSGYYMMVHTPSDDWCGVWDVTWF